MFRFILPNALIRTAGGREVNLRDLQAYALKGGLNGIMVGGYLTTGGRSPQDDLQMIQDLELSRIHAKFKFSYIPFSFEYVVYKKYS